MSKSKIYDTAIAGGGLAGLSMACLLGGKGLSVACIDPAPAKAPKNTDLRTTAISYGSSRVLDEAGIWAGLEADACPINDIRILDGSSPLLLNFLSDEVAGKSFGWIVENADLLAALRKHVKTLKNVDYKTGHAVQDYQCSPDQNYVKCILRGGSADTGTSDKSVQQAIEARLVIGADGRRSFTREWMGVHTRGWSYRQRAVICTVSHANSHENAAVEHFWPEGPFAILPMTDGPGGEHRSSVVFTEHGPESRSLMRLSDEAFEAALAARFPASYGDIRLIGKRACYPLGLVHAASYTGTRMALIADAAHGIHPIAGQGLNLGFRDIKALSELVCEAHSAGQDIGGSAVLEAFQRARRFDNMAMVAVTDGLNRLFSNNIPPVRLLRRVGLKMVSKIRPAKQFFMKQAMGDR